MRINIRRQKYNSSPTLVDGIRFDSKREASRYSELKELQKAGEVLYFLRQVPIDLASGKKYRVDFLIVWINKDGLYDLAYEDVKGYRTETYKLKKTWVESQYPIKIEET